MKRHTRLDWGRMAKTISPYNLKKALLYMKHFGLKGFAAKLTDRFEYQEVSYEQWRREHSVTEAELEAQRKTSFVRPVLFSIVVPLYRTPEAFLRRMLDSVLEQSYGCWELLLADASPRLEGQGAAAPQGESNTGDGPVTELTNLILEYQKRDSRIRYQVLEENRGISENTNRAMEMAKGELVCFLDHDDFLSPDALFELANMSQKHPEADVIYSDEDKVTAQETEYFQPHFKPDFNLDLLRSNNYICHFLAVRKSLTEQVGGLDARYDGAQDHEFLLRCAEKARAVCHVPKVLYHWRVHSASTADNPFSKEYAYEAGQRAIDDHLVRCGVKGRTERLKDLGFYRVVYEVKDKSRISILIPNMDHTDILQRCVESIWEKSTYSNYEILVIENNSRSPETFAFYEELEKRAEREGKDLRVIRWPGTGFHYPDLNNFGAEQAQGEYLILLNNDITVITPGWMEELLGVCQRKEVGIVGARLYYPDDTVQHAGIIVGIGGIAGSLFVGLPRAQSGYMHKAALMQDLSAVTAACMMVKSRVYRELGGMETALSVTFNDVDFCLRAREKGYLVVYDPFVEMYHHESRTRGAEDSKEKIRRFQTEIEFMRSRWIKLLKEGDPYYNPNFSLKTWNYELKR